MNAARAESYRDLAWSIGETIDRPNKHISFVFKGSSVISIGTNHRRTHPLAARYGYLFGDLHSELAAWLPIRHKHKSGLVLLNFHFNNRGIMKMSLPCQICRSWSLCIFDKIVYSTSENSFEVIKGVTNTRNFNWRTFQ